MRQFGLSTNFLTNAIGAALPAIVSLLTVPLYLSAIGNARYGVMSIVWILLGYFGFLDFGLSRASANALGRLGPGTGGERPRIVLTSIYLNTALGLGGGLLLYALKGIIADRVFHLTPQLSQELHAAFPWVVAMLPVALVSGVAYGALESREHFLLANLLQASGNIAGMILPVSCAKIFGPSLVVIIPAAFAGRFVTMLITLAVVVRNEKISTWRHFDRQHSRRLFGYGAWVTVSNVVQPILDSLDQLVIGALLGVAAVPHYAVPQSLATRSQIFSSALARALFPRLSRLPGPEARRLAERAMVTLAFTFAAICAPSILLANLFMHLWIGARFATVAGPIAQLLMLGAWFAGMGFIPYTLMTGQGRPDLPAKAHAAEIIPFIAVVYLMTLHFGLNGAAIAAVGRVAVDATVMLVMSRCSLRRLLPAAPALGFLVAALCIARSGPHSLFFTFAAAVALGAGALCCGVVLDETSRRLAWKFAARLRHARPLLAPVADLAASERG